MNNKQPKIAINGFGRIGRQIFRINMEKGYPLNIVAVNNIGDNKTSAHLLKYDSSYGTLPNEIVAGEDGKSIRVDGHEIAYLQIKDPATLPWKDLGVDIVIECTGVFTDRAGASKHLEAGAKKVLISAPGKEIDITLVMGVNQEQYDPAKHHIISNASCTTNCMAPLTKVLHEQLGIKYGLMTTVHAFTNDQRLQDLDHKDLRRARAAGQSIIPTTTGAAKTVGEVIPDLKGKLNGHSIRVPIPVVSILDFTFLSAKPTTVEEVNSCLDKAAAGSLKGILGVSHEPLVSIDYKKDDRSSIVDALSTLVMEGNMVKVLAWYDNEWGYSVRTVEMTKMIADQLPG
jgi:glyceraldehyde 3-phosphate dehydrogenase